MSFLTPNKIIKDEIKAKAILMAIGAAALYGISAPLSKLLLVELPPAFMAALLYLGAGFGMALVNFIRVLRKKERIEAKITRSETKYVVGMILLDIAAPMLLMLGLNMTTAANVSLLNNFEIVATALIAYYAFNESIGKRMGLAILLITLSSLLLSFEDFSGFSFSAGSIFVLLACISWGFENNCTRMLSIKDPLQVVVIKGFGAGLGSLIIAIASQGYTSNYTYIGLALLLGFVAYGLSIFLYISAQRELGAARTSAYYAAAPFIGVLISWIVLNESLNQSFLFALVIMLLGTYFAVTEKHIHRHIHEEENHEHKHDHKEVHHMHNHSPIVPGEHTHEHHHNVNEHRHPHLPDLHHKHKHKTIIEPHSAGVSKEELKNE